MPRFYCPIDLISGAEIDLPAGAARHAQVLRLQPGDGLTLFYKGGQGEFDATVVRMGRSDVRVQIGAHHAIEREAIRAIHLLVGSMANERMDWLVEKATELGVASITPLLAERSVLKLKGERAEKKQAHWQAIAIAACEQCGRNQVPPIYPVQNLSDGLAMQAINLLHPPLRLLLSLRPGSLPLHTRASSEGVDGAVVFLSGPEGGLTPAEEEQAMQHGFAPVTLGQRVLRAETAPLAALAALSIC